ncbi:uncharacterized protein LOC117180601 [Belonocnema kinseyi]|uniref:uncharacterized protein LOC117180601 n=1 Tax=Belonocnema kinseyi TaxID=2817044 RepID=UPI00143DCF11|nr:uncharacterized protein LOC117180601 [Belonocnema kinseyi]
MQITEEKIWEVQSGFMPERSCTDHIFSLRQITEKSLRVGKTVFCTFVDLEKAVDKVVRSKLWEVLKEYGVNGWLHIAIKTIYTGSIANVKDNPNELVGQFHILLASQAAGNPSQTSEFLSLIEELQETGIIY